MTASLARLSYEVDRAAGDRIRQLHPGIGEYARVDRLFLGRAVRHLVAEAGIRQFLDIGTGPPTADHTHEVAQGIAPETRIVEELRHVRRGGAAEPSRAGGAHRPHRTSGPRTPGSPNTAFTEDRLR